MKYPLKAMNLVCRTEYEDSLSGDPTDMVWYDWYRFQEHTDLQILLLSPAFVSVTVLSLCIVHSFSGIGRICLISGPRSWCITYCIWIKLRTRRIRHNSMLRTAAPLKLKTKTSPPFEHVQKFTWSLWTFHCAQHNLNWACNKVLYTVWILKENAAAICVPCPFSPKQV